MLSSCYRAILLCWLTCWSLVVTAGIGLDRTQLDVTEQSWLSSHDALVVGMPSESWPPYVYTNGRGDFSGPLDEFASQVASRLGLTLRYQTYPSTTASQQALLDGRVDMLIGGTPSQTRQLRMRFTSPLMAIPRGIMWAWSPHESFQVEPLLAEARGLRWLCNSGFNGCEELLRLGITGLVTVDSSDEAIFMLREGQADAYLADLPALVRLQSQANMQVAAPGWMRDTSLAMAVGPDNKVLQGLLERALNDITPAERHRILEADGILDQELDHAPQQILFNQREQDWLAQHPVLKYGVALGLPGLSELDEHGRLKGFTADLLALMSQRSGLKFSLVPTSSWAETLTLFQERKLDFLPSITPTEERHQFARFTPEYSFIQYVIAARQGEAELSSLDELRGRKVGMVGGTVVRQQLLEVGADPVVVDTANQLLPLLDNHQVNYTQMNMPTLQSALQKGFIERYKVVFSGKQLRVPLAMAAHRQDPMLQQILTKVLLSIQPQELAELENKWVPLTIQTGINSHTVTLWSLVGVLVFLLCVLLFMGWNRTLRRQITQRQLAEQQLSEQLVFVQTLLNSLPNMVVLRDKEQRITLCNQAYRDAFIGEQSGLHHRLENLPDWMRERVDREEQTVWQSGKALEGSGYCHHQDGVERHVIYVRCPYHSPSGEMLGVLTVVTDVSEIKSAEARARQAENRLTHITDSVPGVVYQYLWLAPGKGRVLYASQGVEQILGVSQQEMLLAKSGNEVYSFFTEEERLDYIRKVAECAKTLAPIDVEIRSQHPEGERYLQMRGCFMREEEEGNLIINGVIYDITALKQQERELREARAYAEQAMQMRNRFLATMSHELRTPISGMNGMLELVQMSELNEDQRYLLRNITTSVNNLHYLVNDILDFSKIESGQLHLHYHPCHLTTVICDVIRGHATQAHGKGLKVTLEWAAEVPDQASIDAVRVGQVVSNLLSNAVKFTEQGEIRIRVGYRSARLEIAVTDTGIGIERDKQQQLFTPFKQIDSDITRRFGGTGLGLAICQQLTQIMGGSLTLESQSGVGTCLTFCFPLMECQWDAPPLAGQAWWLPGENIALHVAMQRLGATLYRLEPQQWQQLPTGLLLAEESWLEQKLGDGWLTDLQQSALKGIVLSSQEPLRSSMGSDAWWRLGQSPLYPDLLLETCRQLLAERTMHPVQAQSAKLKGRVLVADDHPVNRALLARQLALLGLDAEVVDDGEKALCAWQGQDFSLLLTDCHMPAMDGYTLTQTLRASGEQAPIIGVTADTSAEASSRMRKAGMDDMLFKPYTLEILRQKLEQWLPLAEPVAEPSLALAVQKQGQEQCWLALFGDEAVARSMAREYLVSNRQDGEEMTQALAQQDTQMLLDTAHRIKGAASIVGLSALAAQAARLESAARFRQMDELDALSQTLQVLMHATTREIGTWLDEHATA